MNPNYYRSCTEGLGSFLLGLRINPTIRYDASSEMAKTIAQGTREILDREEETFNFRKQDSSPILLVLDRRSDLVTPLLLQWSYQAMVHDLFGLSNSRLNMSLNTITDEKHSNFNQTEYVLCPEEDGFFKENMDNSFGDLGENIRLMVQNFQDRTKEHQSQLDSLPSMKKFIEDYPEYRKMSSYVSKHVEIVGEMSKRVQYYNLMQISELEQRIASEEFSFEVQNSLSEMLQRQDIFTFLKEKLALLFCLRYHLSNNFNFLQFVDLLRKWDFSTEFISVW